MSHPHMGPTTKENMDRIVQDTPKDQWFKYAPEDPRWFSPEADRHVKKNFWAVPYDARFPQKNQTRKCWSYYIDYHRCLELKGQDYKPCKFFKNVYNTLCPSIWVAKWDEWVERGVFPEDFTR